MKMPYLVQRFQPRSHAVTAALPLPVRKSDRKRSNCFGVQVKLTRYANSGATRAQTSSVRVTLESVMSL